MIYAFRLSEKRPLGPNTTPAHSYVHTYTPLGPDVPVVRGHWPDAGLPWPGAAPTGAWPGLLAWHGPDMA